MRPHDRDCQVIASAPGHPSLTLTAMDLEGRRRDYFGALEWVGGLMRATTPDQMDAPTPCEEFTVPTAIWR
jgi:hypothetical protein